ncbi:hypothetical protein GPV31_21595, partial [Salmonella enterica subsp. enterica serovar Typhimurium]|nr:hypothetical protein [Salmonella enterica subsp. enterica serovar Typhimurium]
MRGYHRLNNTQRYKKSCLVVQVSFKAYAEKIVMKEVTP